MVMRTGRASLSVVAALTAAGLLWSGPGAAAATRYGAPRGDDSSPGTADRPLGTLQGAIARAAAGDTIYLRRGTYDLSGASIQIGCPLTLQGEDRDATVLTNGQAIKFSRSLSVRDLRFSRGPVLTPAPGKGETLDGITIENCVFEGGWAGLHARGYGGAITNVRIIDCQFLNMEGGKVMAIGVFRGEVSNVRIVGNRFSNLRSTQKGCNAVILGDLQTTRNVLVCDNRMDNITGPTQVVDNAGPEVHGILLYGTRMRILRNRITDLNAGQDHEAIYMKARHSTIADNVVENCGSGPGGADICSKGGEFSQDNLITRNRIVSDQPGCGIFASGGTVITDNYVRKTRGSLGINVYPLGRPVSIARNYVETAYAVAIYVNGGDYSGYPFEWPDPGEVSVSGNTAVAYGRRPGRTPVTVTNAPTARVSGNREEQGQEWTAPDHWMRLRLAPRGYVSPARLRAGGSSHVRRARAGSPPTQRR